MNADEYGPGFSCLVTGATGYIGGSLVPERRDHPRAGRVEVVRGDVTDAGFIAAAMHGVTVAHYLLHALCPPRRRHLAGSRTTAPGAPP